MEWRLLEGVPGEEVRSLLSVARRRSFRKGEVVFHRGDPSDSLHLISKGRFKLEVMTPLGEPATIAVRGPGDSFGEMAIVGRAPSALPRSRRWRRRRRSACWRASFAGCAGSTRGWISC
jgi:CRP-like cAMP-binding protein